MNRFLLTLIGSLFLSSAAIAMPITGAISFGGAWNPEDGGGTTVAISAATYIDIDQATVTTEGPATGSFSAIADGTAATYKDFSLTHGGVPSPLIGTVDPIAGLWSVGGFTFDLIEGFIHQLDDFLGVTLSGTGFVSGNGYDTTAGFWVFTSQGGSGSFSFSSTNLTEPGLLGLLGLGLIGLSFRRRRITS